MAQYKLLTELFKSIALTLRASNTFTVARDQALNIKDGVVTPIVAVTAVTDVTNINESGNTKTWQIQIKFLQKDELSKSENSKNNIIAVMEDLKDEFIQKLNDDDAVSLLSNVNAGTVYNQYDQNLTGWQCNLNVELFSNANYC